MCISKLEAGRQEGKNQVEPQRVHILDAAEALFLSNGIEKTHMNEIATAAGINRVSLYRYYPDRDHIAFELAVRMMQRISADFHLAEEFSTDPQALKAAMAKFIDSFYAQREAYRYLGMFDHLYGDHYPNKELAVWYKQQIFGMGWGRIIAHGSADPDGTARIAMVIDCTMSFLQKMAIRGDLLADEQEVSIEAQLTSFKEMVEIYLNGIFQGVTSLNPS